MNETNGIADSIPNKCEICGRQDDTIRYVTYPYVFSFVVVTFQRAFSGCWCRLHRIQRWFAASLITSIFGWLGIPFGILMTPVRLLQLARGGLQESALNGQILRLIGEQKQRTGDIKGAIRCYEASLMYVDAQEVSEQLRTLYRSRSSTGESTIGGLNSLFVFPIISIGFAVIGMLAGVLDFIVRWLSSYLPQGISIFVLVLLQVPLVMLVYFCVALLSYVFQAVVRLTRISSAVFLSIASVAVSLFFINGIVSGGTYGIYFSYIGNGVQELSDEIPATLLAILTHSIPYIFSPSSFANNFSGIALFAVILMLSFSLFALVLIPKVKMLAAQQKRISQLQGLDTLSVRTFPTFGWIGLIGLVLGFAMLFVAAPQKSTVDALEAFDHLGVGYGYQTSSQPKKAIAEYQAAVDLKPRIAIAHILLGNLYLSMGEADKAYDSFLVVITLEPENPVAHNGVGWAYFQQGKYDLASEKFLEALKYDPQNLESHLGIGLVYLNQYKLEESRTELQSVIDISPDIPDAYSGLGVLDYLVNNYDEAIKSFDAALKLNPNALDAYVYKGLIHYKQDKYSEAENDFNSVLKIMPDYYTALSGLGDVRTAVYDFDGGLDYYDQAIASNPNRMDAYISKVGVLVQMGEFDKAISLIKPFVDKDGRVKPIIAYIYYLKDDVADGNRALRESISFAESLDGIEKGQAYFTITAVKFSLSDFMDAKRYGELATKNYPIGLDADTYFYMAGVYSALGDFDRAQESLENGSGIGHSELSLHIARARLLIDQEKLDEAEKELQSALQIDDRSASARDLMSFIHYQQGDAVRALVEAKTAVQLNPYDPYAHSQMAFVYQSMGRTDEALVEAKEAVRLNTLNDTSHYILGVCYMESGMSEEAIGEFEKFLSHYWDRAYVREYKVKAEEYLVQLKQAP